MKLLPHRIYTGIHDDTGFRVDNGVNALRFNAFYVYGDRCWHTEDGIRQLALDILIDALDEPSVPWSALHTEAERADATCAWVPHRHYVPVIAVLARTRAYGRWTIPQPQVIAWLHDWQEQSHRLSCARRYPDGSYRGLTYEAWERMFGEIMGRFGVCDLAAYGMGRPRRMAYYLAGHMPQDIVINWSQRRIAHLSTLPLVRDEEERYG